MNYSPVSPVFAQERVETTTEPNTLTPDLSPAQEQQKEQQQQEQSRSDSIILTDIERLELVETAGDAAQDSNYLTMSATGGDEECCQVIQYTPGPIGVAGVTFKGEQAFDLTGAKRVVFFAKGQQGGENVRFLAAGSATGNISVNDQASGTLTPSGNLSQPISTSASSPASIFQGKNFGRITENLILDTKWNRYQISLDGADLREITDPFGFIIGNASGSGSSATFSLKGVSYDAKVATDPVSTLDENVTASSLPSNSTTSSLPSNSTTSSLLSNSTGSNLPPATPLSNQNATNVQDNRNSTRSTFDANLIEERKTADNIGNNANKENIPLNQNLTQPSSGNTPVNSSNTLPESLTSSFILPLDNSSQLASINSLNYSSAESEWVMNDNRAFTNRSEIDGFAASSDNKAASSPDVSTANRNNQALEPVDTEVNTTSSTASTNTPVGDNTQFANGVGQLHSISPGSPGIDIEGQYLYGTGNAQSSALDANAADPSALYQNASTPPTFGPIVPDNQEGEISTDQSAPYGTSSNLAVSQGTSAIDTYSIGPSSELPFSFPQPSLLPSEAFAPAAPDNVPPETVLPLVIDINTGSPIQNGGATDSNSILSITFEGLDETGSAVAGFQCSIDGSPSYYCTTPAIVDNNQLGSVSTAGFSSIQSSVVHTFRVSAVDAAGNLDPTPASFEWNIVNSIPSDTAALDTNAPDTTPPDTQIVSAVDSSNAEVSNGSSLSVSQSSSALPVADQGTAQGSAANTITFSFAGTDDSNIVTGYECATYSSSDLPEQVAFAPCSSPVLSQITEGSTTISPQAGTDDTRTFQVRATDAAGNVDPSPATFQWTDNPTIVTQEVPLETGFETLKDQDPLLQQQQQQQLPQDPLLQQQQQQLPQDPLLQHPGITIQGSFPATGQSGLITQQGFIQELTSGNTEHVTEGQNTLSSPSVLQSPIQNTPSLPSGTTIYGSSDTGTAVVLGAD